MQVEYKGMMLDFPDCVKEWRELFAESVLKKGQDLYSQKAVFSFELLRSGCRAAVRTKRGVYRVLLQDPQNQSMDWEQMPFACTCPQGKNGRCEHMVSVLLEWESRHGPWNMPPMPQELQKAYQKRKKELGVREDEARLQKAREDEERRKQEALEDEKRRKQEALEAELNRQLQFETEEREWEEGSQKHLPVLPALGREVKPQPSWYDLEKALSSYETNEYFVSRYTEKGEGRTEEFVTEVPGQHVLIFNGYLDGGQGPQVRLQLEGNWVIESRCSCYRGKNCKELCSHQLFGWGLILDWINAHPAGDVTDEAAKRILAKFSLKSYERLWEERRQQAAEDLLRTPSVFLIPRLAEDGAAIEYKAGHGAGRAYAVKVLRDLLTAEEKGAVFPLGKREELDFRRETFDEASRAEAAFLKDTLALQENRGTGYSFGGSNTLILTGAMLDRFYEEHEGRTVEHTRGTEGGEQVTLKHVPLRLELADRKVEDSRGRFMGVEVCGTLPPLKKGERHLYGWMDQGSILSRLTEKEMEIVQTFPRAGRDRRFSFRVGISHLAGVYRRTLPYLLEVPGVEFTQNCRELVEAVIPGEAAFRFNLSLEEGILSCECLAQYGEASFPLLGEGGQEEGRDLEEERLVRETLSQFFTGLSVPENLFTREAEDDDFYEFLRVELPVLESLGKVYFTKKLQGVKIWSAPQISCGVSMVSGILELEIKSEDMTREDLLGLLNSYRRRRSYYRLRSGDFVDLRRADIVAEFDSLLAELRIHPDALLQEKIELPLYRALYLDHLLGERGEIYAERDSSFRALLKNFAAIQDADWEVPEELSKVLRPYQIYGYRWLRTLYASGFCGILADEMGLGKTLQMAALMEAAGEEEGFRALVVCPASLVFNWKQELARFAPSLRVTVLAGQAKARKEVIDSFAGPKGEEDADVYITSYELLRRDILAYQEGSLTLCVLDEAQFIRNQTSAVSKTVRLIPASHRFALTGTPIENRLSELWSIFEFLMPGFLYEKEQFRKEVEEPIVRLGDEKAAQRLRAMTGPFILRRLKGEVLKDLPEKLEEVRVFSFEKEQRHLYDAQAAQAMEVIAEAGQGDKMKIFTQLLRLRQICCDPSLYLENYTGESAKRAGCLDLIRSAVDAGHRILLFSQFARMLELLEEDLKAEGIACYKIAGDTPKEKRVTLVRDFNEGDVPVFLISLRAGGTGLNLTGADTVIHYDPWWNLAVQNQATDRAHRIGQAKKVMVYRMIVKDTIEERILQLQETKRDLADSILSGDHASILQMSAEELMELLR